MIVEIEELKAYAKLIGDGIYLFINKQVAFSDNYFSVIAVMNDKKVYVDIPVSADIDKMKKIIKKAFDQQVDFEPFNYEQAMTFINDTNLLVAREGWFPNEFAVRESSGNIIRSCKYWDTIYVPTVDDMHANDWVLVNRKILV